MLSRRHLPFVLPRINADGRCSSAISQPRATSGSWTHPSSVSSLPRVGRVAAARLLFMLTCTLTFGTTLLVLEPQASTRLLRST